MKNSPLFHEWTRIGAVHTARMRVNLPFTSAHCYAMDGEKTVQVIGNVLTVEGITEGGIIVLES